MLWNVPAMLLNAAFCPRSPVEYLHKYPHFFEEAHDFESMLEFFATETWLHDSLPVIGKYSETLSSVIINRICLWDPNGSGGAEIDLSKISDSIPQRVQLLEMTL